MEENKEQKFRHISRESMGELLKEVGERGIQREDIVDILVKGNAFYLIYVE